MEKESLRYYEKFVRDFTYFKHQVIWRDFCPLFLTMVYCLMKNGTKKFTHIYAIDFYQLGARFCLEDLFNSSSLLGVFPHILISSELGCRHHQDLRTERYFPNSGSSFICIHPWLILSPLPLSQIICSFVVTAFYPVLGNVSSVVTFSHSSS